MEKYNKLKSLGIIFAVLLVGVGLFDLGFTILYKNELEGGSCELCFELNPDLAGCENYRPVNLSDLLKNITVVSYEK